LLNSWNGVPGEPSGTIINVERIQAWVRRTRELFAELDRAELGDRYIGAALSAVPPDVDGVWPHIGVCEIIEAARSDALERGFEIAVYNRRGIVSKGEFEGGAQERVLADQFAKSATLIASGWGRTAAMLRRLADAYASEALREDHASALWRDLNI